MNATIKVDLHTHSIISYDSGITARDYETLIENGTLDCVAITDHNETRFARVMQKKLGKRIIVGEEIDTKEGEIIGLFLEETIPADLSLQETIANIKLQKGLVYVPHPFETLRKGIQEIELEKIHKDVDIIETFNGRGLVRGKSGQADAFATKQSLTKAASSDAHGLRGLGHTYSLIADLPEQNTLKKLLQQGSMHNRHAPFYTLLYPSFYKIKNRLLLPNHE